MPNPHTTSSAPLIDSILKGIHDRARTRNEGTLASYIPELAKVAPDSFGIAIATVDGQVHAVGDSETPFTIQSVSKAPAFCLALELAGRDRVFQHVEVEPSGDPFNAIELDPATGLPYNPMVNAGAITIAGLLRDRLGEDAFPTLHDRFSKAAGRILEVDEAVFRAETVTGHRNRGIGHLLVGAGVLRLPVESALELYFRQCAIRVTAVDLAMMGATFANLGINPVTGEQVFEAGAIRDTLAVMFTCGMYDYSGNWAYDVGIPAKSGVGGGILGTASRQLGIGTYSPRLDEKGNSVRGLDAFKAISEEIGLHAFDPTRTGSGFTATFFRQRDRQENPRQSK